MKDFIVIALWGITSFVIFNLLWKVAAKKYKKLEAIQMKFSSSKRRGLYSSIITFILVILIVVIKEMFAIGDFLYGLLLGALLSVSDFLFNKIVTEEEKNEKNNKNNSKSNKLTNKKKIKG